MRKKRQAKIDGTDFHRECTTQDMGKNKTSISPILRKNGEQIIPKTTRLTMTIHEFAELVGISKNLAYTLARQDKLPVPVIHLGEKRECVSVKAVIELLETTQKTENHIDIAGRSLEGRL